MGIDYLQLYPEVCMNDFTSVNRSAVHRAFRSVLNGETRIAVLHSSLHNFRIDDTNLRWHFLSAISFLVEEGWTLLFPSFTFSFCSGTPYIKHGSPSETGVLADLVLEHLPSSTRTNSPIYSFVVVGKRSDELLNLEPQTTLGIGSPFEWLEQVNANAVMLGCDWKYCTQFHRYEELENVEYRLFKTFTGMADYGDGVTPVECTHFVRDLELNPINDFAAAFRTLDSAGEIRKASLFGATIQSTEVRCIENACLSDLRKNPFCYLSDGNLIRKKIRDRAERKNQLALKVSILGHKNNDILSRCLNEHLVSLVPERAFELVNVPYGQLYRILIDRNDDFWASPPSIRIFADRLEDLPGFELTDVEKTLEAVEKYAEIIHGFHESASGWSIVNLFASVDRSTVSSNVLIQNATISRANTILTDAFKNSHQIAWVDINSEISMYSGPVIDNRLSFLGKFAWGEAFSDHMTHSWASLITAIVAKDTRLMIIDLDNTLWGGVLGEDGIEGVQIGGDYPGNAFKAFQEALLKHSERGVALAIASKNDQDLALRALTNLPDMVIREHDLQSHAINWEPKWQNIVRICDELNLGLGSVLFIDDSPVEREAVRRNLPDVKILPLSNDPADYVSILKSCPYLRPISVSREDLGRLRDFSVRKKREYLKASSSTLDDYFGSLDIFLNLNTVDTTNSLRAAQLCQKTNQFNSTVRRYDQKNLYDLVSSGADVLVVNYEDKFSPAENIGLIIIKYESEDTATIDLFLLSCRVLGRGIETIIPKLAIEIAGKKGCRTITAEIIETERNTPVRNVFKDAGFLKTNQNFWQARIEEQRIPNWVKYSVNVGM